MVLFRRILCSAPTFNKQNKGTLKFYCETQTVSSKQFKRRPHAYSYANNWASSFELVDFLSRNVIFNEGGLVAINKPFGVGKQRLKAKSAASVNIPRLKTSVVGEKDFYICDVLPELAKKLDYKKLDVVRIPERYTSGVTILSSCNEITAKVQKCIKVAKNTCVLPDTYWAVVVGVPEPETSHAKFALKIEDNPVMQGRQPVLLTSWTNKAVKRGDVKLTTVRHSILSRNHSSLACLVEVLPSHVKAHLLRIYMAYMLSPILGDNLYGGRVQTVKGVSILISPFSSTAQLPQRLNKELLAAVALRPGEEPLIPPHIHLRKTVLVDFRGKGTPLILEAPMPEAFEWTCKQFLLHKYESNEEILQSEIG